MGARRKKSKKRSAASSQRRPDPTVFFIDRNLGRSTVAAALRTIGEQVEVHDDHLPSDAPDADWINLCGVRRWLAITRDKNIRYREWEKASIRASKARIFVLRAKNLTGEEMGKVLAVAVPKMQSFSNKQAPPFVAAAYRDGSVKMLEMSWTN